ncbi:serine/threonine-protein kinase [uncultured Senegalimassilia sp.]|uniref:serine/threonine-protein kinase n=1 Tax=uncultured Senegalimassilia sp. TaxID=1714350 RepID=UPI0025DEBE26|nr:serine/threonine-protein kinase [uncultured Senegalimassilia sp.]
MARKRLQYNVRMTKTQLILNRYKPLAKAGAGGFGTVQVAWDTRIQRKVAIKCIPLSEAELLRAALPGADAIDVSPDERSESVIASSVHAAGSAGSSSSAVDPADVPPWEDLPEEAGFAGSGDAGDSGASDDQEELASVSVSRAGSDSAGTSSSDASLGQLLPGQSVSLTNAVDPASRPLVRTLSRIPGLDEARTAAILSDPSIVTVHDFEIQDSTAYLIMEYVEGMTLTELLRDHDDRLTLDVVAAVFDAVAHALEVAHENGVLHLDIKPDNILINASGQVKVTDFGLATLADAQGYGVAGGGTIGYMPLEQMRQENLDARCDEWALASVTYEMLAGENPFLAPNLFQAQEAIEDGELVLPSLCWDNLDPAADDPIFYALDPEREERYETVADFAEELSPFLGDPAKGRAELADIVAGPEEEEEPEPQPREPGIPLRDRITPELLFFGSHACGAAGSALLAFVALQNISQTEGLANPLFWGLLLLITLAGALRPHLGALLGFVSLSAMLVMCGVPAAGCVLLAGTGVWWWYLGRAGDATANAALATPLAGAIGLRPLGPLAAGFALRPVAAMATAAFQVLCGFMLAGLGSASFMGWDVLATWHFSTAAFASDAVMDRMAAMLTEPGTWIMAASWVLAAGACALLRWHPTRLFASFGVLAGAAVLVAGFVLAAVCGSPSASAFTDPADVASLVVSSGIMLFAAYLLPDPEYYDESGE